MLRDITISHLAADLNPKVLQIRIVEIDNLGEEYHNRSTPKRFGNEDGFRTLVKMYVWKRKVSPHRKPYNAVQKPMADGIAINKMGFRR